MSVDLIVVDDGHVLGVDEARALIGRIRQMGDVLKVVIIKAYRGQAWVALGYGSWDEMCDAEFGGRIALPRDERQSLHVELRAGGMSTRAIAAVTGVDQATVSRDLSGVANASPAPVVGLDGKQYTPPPPPRPLSADEQRAIEEANARRDAELAAGRILLIPGEAVTVTGGIQCGAHIDLVPLIAALHKAVNWLEEQ